MKDLFEDIIPFSVVFSLLLYVIIFLSFAFVSLIYKIDHPENEYCKTTYVYEYIMPAKIVGCFLGSEVE